MSNGKIELPAMIDMDSDHFIPAVRGRKTQPDEMARMIADHMILVGDSLALGECSKGQPVPVPERKEGFLPGDNVDKIKLSMLAVRVNKIRKLVETERGNLNVNFRTLVSARDGSKYSVVFVRRIK